MQLSVVIPVYNGAQFLEAAVKSIYVQTYLPEDFEIILVDDGSSDHSIQICQRLAAAHPEINLLRHEVNKGVAAARNLGVKSARGEFLAMLDQDDTWTPNKLEWQFKIFQDDPGVDLALGMLEFSLVGIKSFPSWFKPAWADAPQLGYVFGCMLIRRAIFLEVGLLDETLKMTDDYDWFARVKSSKLREHMLSDVILVRKIHASNASADTKLSNAECLKVIRRKISRR